MRFHFNKKLVSLYSLAVIVALSLVIASLATVTSVKAAAVSFSGNISFSVPKPVGETTYGPSAVELINTTSPSAPKATTTTGTDILNGAAITKPGGDPNGGKCVLGVNNANPECLITLEYRFSDVNLNDNDMYKVCIKGLSSSCSITFKGSEVASKYNNIMHIANPSKEDVATIVAAATGGGSVTAPKTCGGAVEAIGWIVCPVMNFIAKVNDASYRAISALLIAPSLDMSTGSDNSIYQAWGAMRSFANVAFVIVFLIIIFSQLTSVGITNYGVKKMLPRLVIAAILVNISYFVCAIAVDASNILGTSLIQVFNSVRGSLNQPLFQTSTVWTSLLLTVVGGGVLLYAGLSILLPALVTALFAIITVFLTLTVRQALIIILIVISPLAFVAFLLPNTESLFKKWQNLLTTLLLLFPIISVVFGASAFASQVIITSASGPNQTFVQIMGALVAVIPLFLVPSLMKAGGGVLGKVSGAISNSGLMKGASGGLNKVAGEYRKDRLNTRDMRALKGDNQFGRGRFVRWRNKTKSIRSGRESEMNRANTEYIAGQAEGNAEFRNALAGGTKFTKAGEAADNRALASGMAQRKKIEEDEVTNAETLMRAQNDATVLPAEAQKIFENAVKSGNTVQARAAQRILLSSGAPAIKMLHESVERIRGTDGSNGTVDNRGTVNSLRNDINTAGIKGKDAVLSAWGYKNYDPSTETDPVKRAEVEEKKRQANADLGYDGVSIGTIGTDIGTFSGLNPVELAGQDIAVLREARGVSGNQARDVINNQNASQLLSDEKREHFKKIAAADPVPPTEAPPIIFGPI